MQILTFVKSTMVTQRTRNDFKDLIIGTAISLDPENPHKLPSKKDVLLAFQMSRHAYARQHDKKILPPVKDYILPIVHQVEEIWFLKANIDNLYKTKSIYNMLLKLYNQWQAAVKALRSERSISSFTDSLDTIFDICCCSCSPTTASWNGRMKCSCKPDFRTLIEEVNFLVDQRGARVKVIRVDLIDHAETVKRREYFERRYKREAAKGTYSQTSSSLSRQQLDQPMPRPRPSYKDQETADNGKDKDFVYTGRYKKRRVGLIDAKSCSDSDRRNTSIRGQQNVANAAAIRLGREDECVSRGSVHRKREKFRSEAAKIIDAEIADQKHLQLGFDGKEIHDLERYMFNVIFEAEHDENRNDRLHHVKTFPASVGAQDIFEEVITFEPGFLKKILSIVADTTAVNTGCKNGAFKRIRDYILANYGIEVHALECLMHIIELLFRHFFCFIDGPAKGPDKLADDAVYNLIGTINGAVDNMGELDEFDNIPCSVDASAHLQHFLNATQDDEKALKVRDDRACFFIYAAAAAGLEIPEDQKRFLNYQQEDHGLARWQTTGTGYLRILTHQSSFQLTEAQLKKLVIISTFVVNVFAPSWVIIYMHPSAVRGPENVLKIRDLLLSCPGNKCADGIVKSVKKCFLMHALTWFSPQNLGLSLLSDSNNMSKESIALVRTNITQNIRRQMLWTKSKSLSAFMSPDVAAATCLHHGSKAFWQACMNSNMSCERYVGFIKRALESNRLKHKKSESTGDFDERLRGLIALGYDNK